MKSANDYDMSAGFADEYKGLIVRISLFSNFITKQKKKIQKII